MSQFSAHHNILELCPIVYPQCNFKMAAVAEHRRKQRAVIEFLFLEGESAANIHRRLRNVYGNESLDVSTVRRWIGRIKGDSERKGHCDLNDKPRSGRPASAVNDESMNTADLIIKANRRVTIDELCNDLGISHGSARNLVEALGYSKVCAKWVPRMLTETLKEQRLAVSQEILELHSADNTFLKRIITSDETWIHLYEPESKRSSL